jgi:hypothetical protein
MAAPLSQGNHKLTSSAEAREGIAAAKGDDPLRIERMPKGVRFLDAQGRLLGTLSARNNIAKRIEAGEVLLHCSVAWTYGVSERYPHGLASACVIFGDPEDSYVKWCAREVWGKPREPRPARSYAVNVVGAVHYQSAVANCRVGDSATLFREVGNPHDDRATVVKTVDGQTIGYVPRNSWLQRVVHDDGCGVTATIKSLDGGAPVIEVLVRAESLAEAAWQRTG